MTTKTGRKVFKGKEVQITPAMAKEFLAHGSACAWDGCQQHFRGDMPKGWNWLLLHWSAQPETDLTKVFLGGGLRGLKGMRRTQAQRIVQ